MMMLVGRCFLLFPAYAGVILNVKAECAVKTAFPRLRGGDPRTPAATPPQ